MTYYIKGGSKYNEVNPKLWVGLFLGGFTDDQYLDPLWKNIDYDFEGAGAVVTNQDPFWRLGSASGGAKEFEFGLWEDNRIKVDTSGYWYWDGVEFKDLLITGNDNLGDHVATQDLNMSGFDTEVVGTVYHNDTTRWLTRVSSNGLDSGTLHNIGIYWDTTPNTLSVVGYTNLNLGIHTDYDVVDINASGMRIGGANARINEISTDGTLGGNSDVAVPTEKAVKTYADGVGAGGFSPPIGFISMFSGTWVNNSTITGWYKCDGQNGTPDLRNKFIRGSDTSGTGGGVDTNTLAAANIPQHNHGSAGYHRHGVTTYTAMPNTAGGNNPGGMYGVQLGNDRYTLYQAAHTHSNYGAASPTALDNKPAYYKLIFIMRIS